MIWYFVIFTLVVGTVMAASRICNPFLAYPCALVLSIFVFAIIAAAFLIGTLLVGLLALCLGIAVSL